MKMANDILSSISRRDFIAKTGAAAAGVAIATELFGANGERTRPLFANKKPSTREASLPLTKGQKFNESQEFADVITGRASRRLTCFRQNNMQPAYHLNACFSADSRYLVLATQLADGSSALLKAEAATGEITVVATLGKDSEGVEFGNLRLSGNPVTQLEAAKIDVKGAVSGLSFKAGPPEGTGASRKAAAP